MDSKEGPSQPQREALEVRTSSISDNDRSQVHDFREVLLCQVCKNRFNDPRFLPCHHFFCRSCIENLVVAAGTDPCECPQCHKEINISGNTVAQLPVAFVVERIKERMRSAKSKLCMGFKEHVCQEHGIPLRLYCMECGQLLCPECALHLHQDHCYGYVTSVAPMYMESVKQQFETLTKIKDTSEARIGKIETSKRDLLELSANVTERVNQCFNEIVRLVEKRRKDIIGELTDVVQQQVELYQKQESLLVSTIGHIEELAYKWDRVRASPTGDEGSIILLAELVPTLKQKAGQMAPPPLASLATINIVPDIEYVNEAKALCERIGVHILRLSDPSAAPAQLPTTAELGSRLSFCIPPFEIGGAADVSVTVRTVANNMCTPSICVSPKSQTASFTPVFRGRHELIVEANGKHVTGSPFPLYVTVPLEQLRDPVRIIGGLKAPCALAFNSGGQMVVAHGHPHNRITVCDSLGQTLLEMRHKYLGNPSSVTVDEQDDIYVSDSKNHCVTKLNRDGALLRTIGRYGSGQGEFNSPRGLKLMEGQLYVCDVGNSRVQVFNKQLDFVKSFDVGKDTTDIAASPGGCFYLSGKDIKVLDRDYAYLFSIYDMYSTSVCFDERQNALFLVDCRRNCLCVMNLATDQVVSRCFYAKGAKDDQNRAYGMAIDEDGYIYVCDATNDRIHVF